MILHRHRRSGIEDPALEKLEKVMKFIIKYAVESCYFEKLFSFHNHSISGTITKKYNEAARDENRTSKERENERRGDRLDAGEEMPGQRAGIGPKSRGSWADE